MIKKIMICVIMLIAVVVNTYAEQESNVVKSILKNKPIFSVKAKISGCAYNVRINDVSIISENDGSSDDVTIPVNEWLQSGDNQLSLYLSPLSSSGDNTAQAKKLDILLVA